MIRVLIVDDEPLAREGLRMRLAREHDIHVVGEASDGEAAVELLLRDKPQVVFLDVQMPRMDGFEVLERVAGEYLPHVIFVTAFDRHALRAFDIHALDYLMKPIAEERFARTLNRVRHVVAGDEGNATAQRIGDLLNGRDGAPGSTPYVDRVAVPHHGGYMLLKVEDLDWIAAAANYVELHAGARSWLLRSTLRDLERRLDPRRFVRIHRSSIVALDRVREVATAQHGELEVVLRDGRRLALSRTYRSRLVGLFPFL